MIDKIDNNSIQDLVGKPPAKQPDPAKAVPSSDADVALQADFASLVEKVVQMEQADTEAVERARQLLVSGRLDSRENIVAAVEDILRFSI